MAIQAQFYSENLAFLPMVVARHENASLLPQLVEENNNIQQYQAGSVSAQIENQRLEFEQFFNLQNERLRISLQEQMKHQTAVLMKKYESKTRFLLKQKEEEIAKAANRTMELQTLLKRIEFEKQTWERWAKENEAIVASLNDKIQRVKESCCLDGSGNAAEDAESCCQEIEEKKERICRSCNYTSCCVVMLPCRHLCSCKDCEVFLDSCPVCRMPKKATIQALI